MKPPLNSIFNDFKSYLIISDFLNGEKNLNDIVKDGVRVA